MRQPRSVATISNSAHTLFLRDCAGRRGRGYRRPGDVTPRRQQWPATFSRGRREAAATSPNHYAERRGLTHARGCPTESPSLTNKSAGDSPVLVLSFVGSLSPPISLAPQFSLAPQISLALLAGSRRQDPGGSGSTQRRSICSLIGSFRGRTRLALFPRRSLDFRDPFLLVSRRNGAGRYNSARIFAGILEPPLSPRRRRWVFPSRARDVCIVFSSAPPRRARV